MRTIPLKTLAVAALASLAVACSPSGDGASAERLTLNGAGASFPAPVYNVWTYAYTSANLGAKVNYQSVGSGAGINQIKAKTVDFAGTDSPLTPAECEEAGLIQFPILRGAVVPIVNLPGIAADRLKLDNALLADLFLGRVTRWNDARIAALNPGLKLPDLAVSVVHRSDSSGTSFVFTDYLSSVSADWKTVVGAGANVKWPTGIGGQKNPGVCNAVAKIAGAIGYTEYTYALEAKLSTVLLPDAQGAFVAADAAAWPILGTTYILVRKDTEPTKMDALKAYFRWCYEQGAGHAVRLHYAPLAAEEAARVIGSVLK